jgi:hypothetical protein
MQELRAASGGNWSIRRAGAERGSWEPPVSRDSAQDQSGAGLGTEDDKEVCRLKTIMTWDKATMHIGETIEQALGKERYVEIDYYDSWTVLKERCVRNGPPRQSMLKTWYYHRMTSC